MIDSSETNNFISNLVVQRLKIPCETCEKFGVILGNGTEIHGQDICRQFCLQMQGIEVIQEFLSLILGNTDLILEYSGLKPWVPDDKLENTSDKFHTAKQEGAISGKSSFTKSQDFIEGHDKNIDERRRNSS